MQEIIREMLAKKMNIMSRAECFDYEAFAPQLQRNPCIWDLHDENYNLAEYRALAFKETTFLFFYPAYHSNYCCLCLKCCTI